MQRGILFLWMNNLGLDDIPTQKDRICSDHFNSEDVVFGGRRMTLQKGALPLSGREEREEKFDFSADTVKYFH